MTAGTSFIIQGGIVDLQAYRVAVANVNQVNMEMAQSDWVTADITPQGKSVPPEDVTGFSVSQNEDRLIFYWNEVSDLDFDYYEIRRGANWDSAVLIERTVNIILTLSYFPFGFQTYLIKARDTSGNYSATAASAGIVVTSISGRNELLNIKDLLAGTIGSGLDWEYSDINSNRFRKCVLIQTVDTWDNKTGTRAAAETAGFKWDYPVLTAAGYYTGLVNDVGSIITATLSLTSESSATSLDATIVFEERHSSDNMTWSSWTDILATAITFRYLQVRAKLQTTDANQNIRLFWFSIEVDVPDLQETICNQAIANVGTALVFSKTYHSDNLAVIVTPVGATAIAYAENITSAGCTVHLKNISGAGISGVCNILISGF
jgi:hypothetical protein